MDRRFHSIGSTTGILNIMTFLFRTVHMTYLRARVQDLHQKRSLRPRGRPPVMQIVPWFSNVASVVAKRQTNLVILFIVEISLGYFFIVDFFLEHSRL